MSVETTADKHLKDAREHVQNAIESLAHVVVGDCGGWNDYNEQYTERLNQAFKGLLGVRQKLG